MVVAKTETPVSESAAKVDPSPDTTDLIENKFPGLIAVLLAPYSDPVEGL